MSSYLKNNFQNILITFFLIFPAHILAMERDYSWGIEENSFLCLQIITDCVFYFYSCSTLFCCHGSTSVSQMQKSHSSIWKSSISKHKLRSDCSGSNNLTPQRQKYTITEPLLVICHGSPWVWLKTHMQKKEGIVCCELTEWNI